MGGGLFQPNGTLTRGQLVTTLYRMAGGAGRQGCQPLHRCGYGAVLRQGCGLGGENGIAKGVKHHLFAPHAPVTREQMVTFLYRYANLAGEDVTGDYDLTGLATMEPFTTMPKGTAGLGRGQGTRHRHGRSPGPRATQPGRRSRLSSCAIVRTYKTVRFPKFEFPAEVPGLRARALLLEQRQMGKTLCTRRTVCVASFIFGYLEYFIIWSFLF